MRTTLAIDDDVLAAARHLAQRDNRSVGEVISILAREGLGKGVRSPKGSTRSGIALLPARKGASPVTPELVNRLRDELP